MNSHSLEDGVVLLQLHTVGGVLTVLRRDVTRSSGQTALLHLCALQNHLNSVAFSLLCHSLLFLCQLSLIGKTDTLLLLADYTNVFPITIALSNSVLEGSIQSDLVDVAQAVGTNVQADPAILLHVVELLGEEVHIKSALGATL